MTAKAVMGSAFHILWPSYSGSLIFIALTATRLWETFTVIIFNTLHNFCLLCLYETVVDYSYDYATVLKFVYIYCVKWELNLFVLNSILFNYIMRYKIQKPSCMKRFGR